MVRISAFPTIEWLSERGDAPLDVQSVPAGGSRIIRNRNDIRTRLADILNVWSNESTVIRTDAWVATPNGEKHIDIVLSRSGRRIGIRLAGPYEGEEDYDDAIALVYGRFDVVHRIHYAGESVPVVDLAYTIQTSHPAWFSENGRITAGRQASSEALLSAHKLDQTGALRLRSTRITRIRLSHASDWVEAFEAALGMPKQGSFTNISSKTQRPTKLGPARD